MDNTISTLRNELFDTLQGVKNNSIPLDKAKVICEISQGIINSAKVEVDFVKAIKSTQGSGFITLNGIDNDQLGKSEE